MNCFACQKKIESEIIYESNFWIITLGNDQAYLGRCYVTLKRHCESLSEVNEKEWNDLLDIVKKFESALKKCFGAAMFNWTCLMNDSYKSENPQPHVHWHVRPRYKNPVNFVGQLFIDSEFAHHYNRERKLIVSDEMKQKIKEKIKSAFSKD